MLDYEGGTEQGLDLLVVSRPLELVEAPFPVQECAHSPRPVGGCVCFFRVVAAFSGKASPCAPDANQCTYSNQAATERE